MKRAWHRAVVAALLAIPFLAGIGRPAHAQAPTPWEMDMQPAFSPVKKDIIALHDLVLVIITGITVLVGVLLVVVMVRFNAKRNPVPSRTSHNTVLEVAWTLIPVLILVIIAIPSFRLVYYEDRTQDADLTVKVTGHQWYWEYTYPDNGNIDFSSYIVPDDQLKPGQMRLLTVDNDLVVPVDKNIRMLTTSGDVIHSLFIPSLGVQRYAIPGRTIETWFRADQGRHLLRRVQPDLRHQPQPHADRRPRRLRQGIRRLAGAGQDQVRRGVAGRALEQHAGGQPAGGAGRALHGALDRPSYDGQGNVRFAGRGTKEQSRCRPPPMTRPTATASTTGMDTSRASSRAGCSAPTTRISARST